MDRKLEYKDLSRVLDHSDQDGTIRAYANQYNIIDSYDDVILSGAAKRTINNRKNSKDTYLYPYLYQHNPSQILGGIIDAEEDDYGLLYKAVFNLDTQLGREAYSHAKKGMLLKSSIGFDIPDGGAEHVQDGHRYIRYIKEIRLWEISLVTFPANPGAVVLDVKSSNSKPVHSGHLTKEGRTFSNANLQKLSAHRDNLRAIADEIDMLLGNSSSKSMDTPSTETRITDLDEFLDELRLIRERGK